MAKYLLKRLGLMLITFVITVFLFFLFIKIIPDNRVPPIGSDDTYYQELIKREGWDKPIVVQFGYWVRNIVTTGSFGFSKDHRLDVGYVYFSRIPASIRINIIPYLLSIPIAMLLGVIAGLYKNKAIDTIISVGIIVFISIPYFVVAVLAQFIFYFELGWAPSFVIATATEFAERGFLYGISTYILPVTVLTISAIPSLARSVRAELTEQLTQDYMLLARSKGLSRFEATMKHGLKNAIAPFLPGIFIGIVGVMSGGIITERIFRVTGTGDLYLRAFNNRDFAMIMMVTTFGQFLSLLTSIISDISYTLFDPRVRVGSGKIQS